MRKSSLRRSTRCAQARQDNHPGASGSELTQDSGIAATAGNSMPSPPDLIPAPNVQAILDEETLEEEMDMDNVENESMDKVAFHDENSQSSQRTVKDITNVSNVNNNSQKTVPETAPEDMETQPPIDLEEHQFSPTKLSLSTQFINETLADENLPDFSHDNESQDPQEEIERAESQVPSYSGNFPPQIKICSVFETCRCVQYEILELSEGVAGLYNQDLRMCKCQHPEAVHVLYDENNEIHRTLLRSKT